MVSNMKRITTIFIAALISLAASAQTDFLMNFDLCGIKPGTMLTKAQIIQRFGNPISIKTYRDPDDSKHYFTEYDYENWMICIDSVEGLCGFTVCSSEYPVATSMIDLDGIRVGDSMDILKRYPIENLTKRPELKNTGYKKLDADMYTFYFPNGDDIQSIEVKNGKIVSITMYNNTTGY